MERFEDALTMIDQGDTPGATALLARLVVRTPAHATVHVLLAQAFERQHRWAEALAAWQTAHLLLPDAPIVQQGSLRAARVLAALRTMTAPAVPPPPPVAPAAPAQEPASDETAAEPEATEPEAAWDPAPPAFDAYTDAPDVPDPYLGETFTEAGGVWEEAWPETAEEPGFEGAADPGTTDADATGDDAGPGAPTETSELPDVSRPWPGMAESPADAADAPADAPPESPDVPADAYLGDDPDVFFDPPAPETAEAPPVEAFPAPLEPAERDAPGAGVAGVEVPAATSGIVLPGSVLSALPQTPPVTPPGTVDETVTGPYEPFDLDDLIASLSGAGRIVPSETPPPPPELDEDALLDDMVSPTLARIHAAQGQYEEAARIYERLAEQEPQRAAEYHAEAAALRQKTSGGA